MLRRPEPSGEHHEGVINTNAEQKERGSVIESDELYAKVAGEAKAGDGGADGGEETEEPDDGL